MAKRFGVTRANLPGVITGANANEPGPNEQDNESVVVRKDIAVSVMQVGYDHDTATRQWFADHAKGLIE